MVEPLVITGMGVVTPYGVGPQVLWEKLLDGESAIQALPSAETAHVQCRVGGQYSSYQPEQFLPLRVTRKLDRFSQFGLIAAQEALSDAGLTPGDLAGSVPEDAPAWKKSAQGRERVGIMVGNNLGGWEFAERELRHLWHDGPREVSPYMATAWFPAAVQGTISIQLGIKGIGRTFLCDRASSAYALIHAARCLQRGHASLMFAGGAEAPFSPYAALCYQTSQLMSHHQVYCPFDQEHDGLVAGEGAAFVIMERLSEAINRKAPIYAELAGWATTHDGASFAETASDGKLYASAIERALEQAALTPDHVDCVFAAGSAVPAEDASEVRAIHQALGSAARNVPVSAPKAAFGNLYGAATAVDVIIALLALQHKVIPPTLHLEHPVEDYDLPFVAQTPRPVEQLDNVVVLARGFGGANAALVLRRWQPPEGGA
ncbi:MAG TPA: beta-ketoacyl-[acyl-carrier-protein] synthase family protein [Ktedonobacteraceae bacterium]|nr:beta-ketoacyl-[acyl-carrier-protein] synthase family protein [Ktedonobacteraceae bacterium]